MIEFDFTLQCISCYECMPVCSGYQILLT